MLSKNAGLFPLGRSEATNQQNNKQKRIVVIVIGTKRQYMFVIALTIKAIRLIYKWCAF